MYLECNIINFFQQFFESVHLCFRGRSFLSLNSQLLISYFCIVRVWTFFGILSQLSIIAFYSLRLIYYLCCVLRLRQQTCALINIIFSPIFVANKTNSEVPNKRVTFLIHFENIFSKVQLFWKGHKNLKKISHLFWRYWVKTAVLSK